MAKNKTAASTYRSGASHGNWIKRDTNTGRIVDSKSTSEPFKDVRREILFPTEPTTIGQKKIDRAVERVVARKK
jgi:hypothetical protein